MAVIIVFYDNVFLMRICDQLPQNWYRQLKLETINTIFSIQKLKKKKLTKFLTLWVINMYIFLDKRN